MSNARRAGICSDCQRHGTIHALGRCRRCYQRQHASGRRAPQARRTYAETAAEVEWIISTDSPNNIAKRLGYKSRDGLYRALQRANRVDLIERLHAMQQAEFDALWERPSGVNKVAA